MSDGNWIRPPTDRWVEGTESISIEETPVVTRDGAEYVIPPRGELGARSVRLIHAPRKPGRGMGRERRRPIKTMGTSVWWATAMGSSPRRRYPRR